MIAVAGFVIGVSERPFERYEPRMALMKFYPFRLADVFVPVGCAIAVVRLISNLETRFLEKPGFVCLEESAGVESGSEKIRLS